MEEKEREKGRFGKERVSIEEEEIYEVEIANN